MFGSEGTKEEQWWENKFSLLKIVNWEAVPGKMELNAIGGLLAREALE